MALLTQRKNRIDDLADSSAGAGPATSAWRRLRRSPMFFTGATIIGVFVLVAALSPLLAPHDPALRLLVDQVSRPEQDPATPGGVPARR
mgnify:CR=1 FL=1